MPIPISPLEMRALFLAYYRSEYGPIAGIMENELEAMHRLDLINAGLLMRSDKHPRLRASRGGQQKMMVITHRGKQVRLELLDLGYNYPYLNDITLLPTLLAPVWDYKAKREVETPCVLINDTQDWLNFERLKRGYPTLSLGWLRKWVNQPYRQGHTPRYLPGVKVGRNWYIPRWELQKSRNKLIKPAIYYSKKSKKKRAA